LPSRPGEVGWGGTCLLTIAVGDEYVAAAKEAGTTKVAYARKHGYRNLFFYFHASGDFNVWCRNTQLGRKFTWDNDQWKHSTLLKYCAISSAVNENGCEKVLFTDADAMIINHDIPVEMSWPGIPQSQITTDIHARWSFAQWPEGFTPDWKPNIAVVPHDSDWCMSKEPGSCGSYKTFATCLNTGAFIMDNSDFSQQLIEHAIHTLLKITQKGCTTGNLNPWQLDQCRLSHGDQCITACAIKHAGSNDGKAGEDIALPEGFVCLDTAARPRLQEMFQLKNNYPAPHNDTFVVNCIGSDKINCIKHIKGMFPHLSDSAA